MLSSVECYYFVADCLLLTVYYLVVVQVEELPVVDVEELLLYWLETWNDWRYEIDALDLKQMLPGGRRPPRVGVRKDREDYAREKVELSMKLAADEKEDRARRGGMGRRHLCMW